MGNPAKRRNRHALTSCKPIMPVSQTLAIKNFIFNQPPSAIRPLRSPYAEKQLRCCLGLRFLKPLDVAASQRYAPSNPDSSLADRVSFPTARWAFAPPRIENRRVARVRCFRTSTCPSPRRPGPAHGIDRRPSPTRAPHQGVPQRPPQLVRRPDALEPAVATAPRAGSRLAAQSHQQLPRA
jgi:hypothetical protein